MHLSIQRSAKTNHCVLLRTIHLAIISSIHPGKVYQLDYGGNAPMQFRPGLPRPPYRASSPFMGCQAPGTSKDLSSLFRKYNNPTELKAVRLHAYYCGKPVFLLACVRVVMRCHVLQMLARVHQTASFPTFPKASTTLFFARKYRPECAH